MTKSATAFTPSRRLVRLDDACCGGVNVLRIAGGLRQASKQPSSGLGRDRRMDGLLGGLWSFLRAAASSRSNLACVVTCHRDALAASTAYEQRRLETIRSNKQKLHELGLLDDGSSGRVRGSVGHVRG